MLNFEEIKIDGAILYQPQPRQKQFHDSILNRSENGYRDFLYGGAAKAGKSHALRWEAHRNCLSYSKIRGLLIRSSFPELERTHLSRLIFDLPSQIGAYNQQKHTFKYYNNSILEFGYGDKKEDFEQYLSAEYDFILVDELTTIPFEFIVMLKMRLAASRADFIPFFAGATNPGSKSHKDVRAFYVRKKGVNAELCPEYDPDEVLFLPATVYDNEILIDRDPGIIKRLEALPEREKMKYLHGNWDIFEGQFFDEWFEEVHVIESKDYLNYDKIRDNFNLVLGMDYGKVSYVYLLGEDYDKNIIIFDEWWDEGSTRSEKINTLKLWLAERKLLKNTIIADTNMWIPDAFDVASTTIPAQEFLSAGIGLISVTKKVKSAGNMMQNKRYRVACNDAFKDLLHWESDEGKITLMPRLKVYRRCAKFIEHFPALVTDEKDLEDIAKDQYDHPYDSAKYGLMRLYTPYERKPPTLEQQYPWLKKLKNRRRGTTIMSA